MRTPKIKTAILEALETAQQNGQPYLKFSEIKGAVESKIGRLTKGSLGNALASLLNDGLIEKQLSEDGNVVYALTKRYGEQTLKDLVLRYTQALPLAYVEFEDVPCAVFISPELEGENIDIVDFLDWAEPSSAIANVIFHDFRKLPGDVQRGIARLILWCYWAAIKSVHHPEIMKLPPVMTRLERCISFASQSLEKAQQKGDMKSLEVEKAVLEILNITKRLFDAESLLDFLEFAEEKEHVVSRHEEIILKNVSSWVHGGERIFHRFVREPGGEILFQLPLEREEDENLLGGEVFNGFCLFILKEFRDFAREVKGSLEEAKRQIAIYKPYVDDLVKLFKKRQFIIIHFFNLPASMAERKLSILSEFEDWLTALKHGQLGHRSWLFKEETLKIVEKACRRVRRGAPPPRVPIDLEPWTLRDVYELHPRGRDPDFWLEILQLLRAPSS